MADSDEVIYNRQLKKAVLAAMFEACDTFYIHCMPHPELYIGKRGLIDKEKAEGIILVLGPYSTRDLELDEQFVLCDMQFSGWESVAIPYECIVRMFDKSGAVIMQWSTPYSTDLQNDEIASRPEKQKSEPSRTNDKEDTVIKVDFSKKKRKD